MPQLLLGAVGSIDADMIRNAVVYIVALILSVTVHEFGHAFVADILGDRLPRAQGRVTLNPVSHADPIGTVLIPLIGFFMMAASGGRAVPLLGWGKPVRISLTSPRYRWGLRRRTADLLISFAGVTMNILFALVLSAVLVIGIRAGAGESYVTVLATFIMMNIGLFFFNLIPCPPLDGGRMVSAALGERHPISQFLERYGFMIFFIIVLTPAIRILMLPASAVGGWWFSVLGSLAR